MLRFELESDRDVLVDGIGLLPAGEAVEVTEDMLRDFEMRNNVKLVDANFPSYVKVSALTDNPAEALDEEKEITKEEEAAIAEMAAKATVIEVEETVPENKSAEESVPADDAESTE